MNERKKFWGPNSNASILHEQFNYKNEPFNYANVNFYSNKSFYKKITVNITNKNIKQSEVFECKINFSINYIIETLDIVN